MGVGSALMADSAEAHTIHVGWRTRLVGSWQVPIVPVEPVDDRACCHCAGWQGRSGSHREEFVPMLAKEDEELGPLDEPQDSLFDRGRIDGWVPKGRTHGQAAFLLRDGPSAEQITPIASTTLAGTWPMF